MSQALTSSGVAAPAESGVAIRACAPNAQPASGGDNCLENLDVPTSRSRALSTTGWVVVINRLRPLTARNCPGSCNSRFHPSHATAGSRVSVPYPIDVEAGERLESTGNSSRARRQLILPSIDIMSTCFDLSPDRPGEAGDVVETPRSRFAHPTEYVPPISLPRSRNTDGAFRRA